MTRELGDPHEATAGVAFGSLRRPRKGRRAHRYRPTAKLARSRLACELRGMLPTLRESPWS